MTENINRLTGGFGITVDFDRDVLPLSVTSVTERHLLFALAKKITARYSEPQSSLPSKTCGHPRLRKDGGKYP